MPGLRAGKSAVAKGELSVPEQAAVYALAPGGGQ